MIQGPSRTRSLDEGNGNAAGVTEDASAETESAVGAVAAEGVEGQPVEGEGTAMREAMGQPSHRNKLKHD